MDKNKLERAKKILQVIKKSERVKINKDKEELHVDKVSTGLKASVFLYDKQQQTKKLCKPAFILILWSLKLDEQLVRNKYAKVAVQSTNTEQAQQKQRSRGSTNFPLTSPKKPSTSCSSRRIRRRRIRRTVADKERQRPAQKMKREEGAKEEEDSELYGTPDNESDSAKESCIDRNIVSTHFNKVTDTKITKGESDEIEKILNEINRKIDLDNFSYSIDPITKHL